jgi:hypothetical protein
MRKIATVANDPRVKRVMLCASEYGCYVFLYDRIDDGPGFADYLQDSIADAEEICAENYGITAGDWTEITDTHEGCQDDWIASVRVFGRESGNPQWGRFERFEDGEWKPINTEQVIGCNGGQRL